MRVRRIWQIELLPTVEADLVCAVFDREHAAEVPVPATKEKVNNLQKQSHTSCGAAAFANFQ